FGGAVFSDDLCMAGAQGIGGYVARALAALRAGCDAVLICNNRTAVHEVIAALPAVPNPAAQVRLMRLHGRPAPCSDRQRTSEARWRDLQARVAACNPLPELGLGEDASV
ncbi:MAG: beta-N-acetylhexosaminidase, partial [Gammaproteobacteria bacterium]|nr:beta-N-acetylhexosaminidase [Gammaproteobacteria bacterium]